MKTTRIRLMELAGLLIKEGSDLDVQAYINTYLEGTKGMEEFDGLDLFVNFLEENKSEIKQAISAELSSPNISGAFAVSKEQIAEKIYKSLTDRYGVNGPNSNLLSRAVVIPNTDQGNRTKQFVDNISQPSMQSYMNIKDLPRNPKQQSWYTKASDGNVTGVANIGTMLYYGAEEAREGKKAFVASLDGWQELMTYLVNTQAGAEASSWKYDNGGGSPTRKQDYSKFGLKVKDLFDKKGEQAATELVSAYASGFGVIANGTINGFVEYAKNNPLAKSSPEPAGMDNLVKAEEALQKFKKDPNLKQKFEKYLAGALEDTATREDLVNDYGDSSMDTGDGFDVNSIVRNIITKKKHQEDFGQYFSDFEGESGSINESIYKQILRIKQK